jgi:hypothetical protein
MDNTDYSQYKRIISDCFWDSNVTVEDIDTMLHSGDLRAEKYLFEKILINSTDILIDLSLFKKDELKTIMKEYKVPTFNYDYIFRRKNIAEVYFFDDPLLIDELKWTV